MSDALENLLDEGERVLWQGKPDGRLRIEWRDAAMPVFSVMALLYDGATLMAPEAPSGAWIFSTVFLAGGVYGLVLIHFWFALNRRAARYALTDKRAFVAFKAAWSPGYVVSYPIMPDTPVALRGTPPRDIYFAANKVRRTRLFEPERIGFTSIEDAEDVYALIRGVQESGRAAS